MSYEQEILRIVKRAALEAVKADKPMACLQGVVESAAPLKIRINQKLLLGAEHILLTDAVRDHAVKMTSTTGAELEEYIMHNALSVGESVILLRCDGGQRYIVLGRLEADT